VSAPGWYPDPGGGPVRKYWDGSYWHDAIPAKPGQPSTPSKGIWILVGVIVGVVILVILVGALSPSPAERECKKAGILNGLQGSELEEMVKVCVEVAEEQGYR
jgi:hypothetical protein